MKREEYKKLLCPYKNIICSVCEDMTDQCLSLDDDEIREFYRNKESEELEDNENIR